MPAPEPYHLAGRIDRLLDAVAWAHTSGPYQALDLRFALRTCDPGLGSYLGELLRPFADGGPLGGALWLSGLERDTRRTGRYVTYAGARRLTATPLRSQMLASLLWVLNQEVVARAEGCLLLHAAAAERDGVVVVLPATQNSGKTTLCAGLLRRGYRYVTDEAVAIDIATGRIRPFPKALSIDAGSWPLFPDLAPPLDDGQRPYVREQWHVPAARLGAGLADLPARGPRVILSPRHATGARAAISPLRPAEGVMLLVDNSFNASRWGQAGLDAATRVVRGSALVGRLVVGDLHEACDLVDRVVDEALAAPIPEEVGA